MFRKSVLVFLVLAAVLAAGCQPASPQEVIVTEVVEVTRIVEVDAAPTEEESLSIFPSMAVDVRQYSSMNGREYVVYVVLPLTYSAGDQTFPVVYVSDGDFYALPTAMAAAQVAFGQEMPEVITVGIGYGGSAMNSMTRREEDMSPEGSESFLMFLEEELIPDIEANYRVADAKRTLMGHSLGGSFSLYTLFNAPDTFSQIIVSSAPCDEACQAMMQAYAADHDGLPVRLFISAGDLDPDVMVSVEAFWEDLQSAEYDSFTGEMAILDGETHLSSRPRAFITALKWVFSAGE